MTSNKKNPNNASEQTTTNPQNTRETVESIIVAFILAFLFRAFVAEAFVIPTGSMAPTLMGAHKDIVCEYCGVQYQSTASFEFNQETGRLTNDVAVGSVCPICRGENAFDLRGNANHATFSGDRILVSKFDYLFRDPSRWDVLVFKYPGDARMNYIKRLVGLPGEQLRIMEGDVYTRKQTSDAWHIARKPPHKIRAMSQVVSDTKYLSKELIDAGWPSLWQPWSSPNDAPPRSPWSVQQSPDKWSAELAANPNAAGETQWLRYFHQVADPDTWNMLDQGEKVPTGTYKFFSLITDFLAYNTTKTTQRSVIYEGRRLRSEITSQQRALDLLSPTAIGSDGGASGLHWVGDLAVEFDVEVNSSAGQLSLDLVEFGIHFRCTIDVGTGRATLHALDGSKPINLFGNDPAAGLAQPTAATAVKGPGRYTLRFANFDDRIVLWVNGSVAKFDNSTDYDSHSIRSGEVRKPQWTNDDPLDAAPIGIGAQGLALKLHRVQVWRDIYYIAIDPIDHRNYTDYDLHKSDSLTSTIPDPKVRGQIELPFDSVGKSRKSILATYSQPEWWANSSLFAQRRVLEFQLEDDHFFPMGDNSAASSDARAWNGHHYVERRYLIGKALLVFWPHYWRAPLPFIPNLSRMRLIR